MNKIVFSGGSGLVVGRCTARRITRAQMRDSTLALDVDAEDLRNFPGPHRCLGLSTEAAKLAMEDPDGTRAAATLRRIADDPSLSATFAEGTDTGACREPILTAASVGASEVDLQQEIEQMMDRDLARAEGARFRFHLVGSGAGGAGSALLLLLTDLFIYQRASWPVDSVRIWLVHAGLFSTEKAQPEASLRAARADADDEERTRPAIAAEDRARMASVQRKVDERLRAVSLLPARRRFTNFSIELMPQKLVRSDLKERSISRDLCARQYAAALALLVQNDIPSLAASAEANARIACNRIIRTEEV